MREGASDSWNAKAKGDADVDANAQSSVHAETLQCAVVRITLAHVYEDRQADGRYEYCNSVSPAQGI